MPLNGTLVRDKNSACVMTIGTFDGVHLGHRLILQKVVSRARKLSAKSLVVTFDSHPRVILKKNNHIGFITPAKDKYALMKCLGVDKVIVFKTDSDFLQMTAHGFLQFLQKKFFIKEFVAGSDFRFGKDAKHGAHTLKDLARDFGFKYHIVERKNFFGSIVSSSRIRDLIEHGEMLEARKLLGRYYMIRGKVVKGNGIGKTLGFPTANILAGDYIVPAVGVYAGYVRAGKKIYLAAINIGKNPTVVRNGNIVIEAHLLGFKGSLNGKVVELYFLNHLRTEKKFSSRDELISAIAKDVALIKKSYSCDMLKDPA